jgi:hypothetical protein
MWCEIALFVFQEHVEEQHKFLPPPENDDPRSGGPAAPCNLYTLLDESGAELRVDAALLNSPDCVQQTFRCHSSFDGTAKKVACREDFHCRAPNIPTRGLKIPVIESPLPNGRIHSQ